MSSGYDPVSYPDKVHFASGDGNHEYRDDHDGYESQNGNGIYNNYTVGPKTYDKPLRIACFKFENSRRSKFMLCCAASVFVCVLVVIIVAVATSKHSKEQQKPVASKEKSVGLLAYGPDEFGKISFTPTVKNTMTPIYNRMADQLKEYSPAIQLTNMDTYIKCNSSTKSLPSGRDCMQTSIEFGTKCLDKNMFGLLEGRPCVLLVLKLDEGVMPKPFNKSVMETFDGQFDSRDDTLLDRYDPSAVSVGCYGKSPGDNRLIGTGKWSGSPVDYNPRSGFGLYYFLNQKRTAAYVYPAVMVQFNTLKTRSVVTIRCTAFAQNFNNGHPAASEVFSTEFTITINE